MKTYLLFFMLVFLTSCATVKNKPVCSCCNKTVEQCDASIQNDIERQKMASDMMQYWKIKK